MTVPSHFDRPPSGGFAIVVIQHSLQPLAAMDRPRPSDVRLFLDDHLVVHALLVALVVIMQYEFVDGFSRRAFPEQDPFGSTQNR